MNEHPLQPSVPATARQQAWGEELHLADLDQFLARLGQWATGGPDWEPYRRAAALWKRLQPELERASLQAERVLVVGLVGGTGVGKSTLLNAIVGQEVCQAGSERRPTTVRPSVIHHPDVDIAFLREAHTSLDSRALPLPLLTHLMLVDCPDPDTPGPDADQGNRDLLENVLSCCDVIVYVASQQKYRSHAVEEALLRHARGRRLLFVQSQAQRDEDIREDWQKHLVNRGFHVPEIFRLDARAALHDKQQGRVPSDASFERFTHLVAVELAQHGRHQIKEANTLDLAGWLVDRFGQLIGQREPALVRLQEGIVKQQALARATVSGGLAEHLRENRYLWRSQLLDQVQRTWGGGLFAAFLRLLSGLGGMARWALVARSRSATQLAVAGATAATLALRERWAARRESRWLSDQEALGISAADLAQARTILAGYAQDAGLTEVNAPPDGREETQLVILADEAQQRILAAVEKEARRRVVTRARPVVHGIFEFLFLLIPAYVVYQLGRNFFYDYPLAGRSLLSFEFLVLGAIWIVVAGWLLRGILLGLLGTGLRAQATALVDEALGNGIPSGVGTEWLEQITAIERHTRQLATLDEELKDLESRSRDLEALPVGRWSARIPDAAAR